jgi:hypothetical protein
MPFWIVDFENIHNLRKMWLKILFLKYVCKVPHGVSNNLKSSIKVPLFKGDLGEYTGIRVSSVQESNRIPIYI